MQERSEVELVNLVGYSKFQNNTFLEMKARDTPHLIRHNFRTMNSMISTPSSRQKLSPHSAHLHCTMDIWCMKRWVFQSNTCRLSNLTCVDAETFDRECNSGKLVGQGKHPAIKKILLVFASCDACSHYENLHLHEDKYCVERRNQTPERQKETSNHELVMHEVELTCRMMLYNESSRVEQCRPSSRPLFPGKSRHSNILPNGARDEKS